MENLDTRAARGIKALLIRQVLLQLCSLLGSIVLARVLAPSQFGLFATVSVTVTLLGFIGDFGLAPSFIQRRAEITDHDLQVGFTLALLLTTFVVAALVVGAPWLTQLYHTSYPDLTWLIRALACGLYLATWRSMSALQLERQLRYGRLAWIEVAEVVSYQVLSLALAFAGFGVWSLIWAVLARGILGALLVYAAAPWKIRLAYDRRLAGEILSYGIPFQIQLIINAGGMLFPTLIAALLVGPRDVGYLAWARNYGSKPQDIVQSVMRVGFSHFSRLQDDRARVERTLIRYLSVLLLMSGVWLACVVTAGPALVKWIFTDKWAPAVPALVLYAAAVNCTVLSSVGAVSLNSLGLVNYATRVMVLRTVVNVVLSFALAARFGVNGVACAWAVAAMLEGQLVYTGLGKGVPRRIAAAVAWIAIPLAAGMLFGSLIAHSSIPLRPRALLTLFVTCLTYGTTAWVLSPRWLRDAAIRKLLPVIPGCWSSAPAVAGAKRA